MDLNYLYHRHGVSLAMAQHASCARSSHAHQGLAAAYAERIAQVLRKNRAVAA